MKKLKVLKKKKNKSKIFTKKPKELSNKQLSFPPGRKKRSKRLTKHQILQNILPFFDSAVISRREHAHKFYAETYDVEVIDNKTLDDSLFLAKKCISDLFRDLSREKRGFKYNLETVITLKRWKTY